MKKLTHIFLYLLSIQQIAFCQGGWIHKHKLPSSLSSCSQNVIESPNGNFITIGNSSDTVAGKLISKLTIEITDSKGNFISLKSYGQEQFQYVMSSKAIRAAVFKDSNSFYYCGVVKSNFSHFFGALIKFNYYGDTIWQKTFIDTSEDLIPHGISKNLENNFLLTGAFQNRTTGAILTMILKTDSNGNEIWRKKIHKNNPDWSYGNSILQDSSTKEIIIVGGQAVINGNSWQWESNVLKVDSSGNLIFQKSLNNFGAGHFLNLIQLQDKSFLTCGSWTDHYTQNDNWQQCYIVKFDINGNLIWSKKKFNVTPYNYFTQAIELSNGNIVVAGALDTGLTQTGYYHIRTCLLKLNKSGDLISQRYIGQSFASEIDEYPLSLASTSDNGFIIASMFPTLNDPTPFNIIKVDSSFCDTSALWCQSLALGLNERLSPEPTMHLFPNPANSLLRVRLGQQPSFNSVIIISDLSGRQIQTIHPEKETDFNINTNNYPNGLYLVQLFTNNLLVDTKKIAIAH